MSTVKRHKRSFAFFCVSCVVVICFIVVRLSDRDRKVMRRDLGPPSKSHYFRVKIVEESKPSSESKKNKVILLWTKFFGAEFVIPSTDALHCPVKDCIITTNRSYLAVSDAVIFHLRDVNLADLPGMKSSWQVWILVHHESPPHTPRILHHLQGFINWTVTYRLDSEICLTPRFQKLSTSLTVKHAVQPKKKMIAWFVSNCKTPGNREGYVRELRKSITVDIYGDCGTKTCLPKMSEECYRNIAADYRYYLAFENSICKDYVTEKFFHATQYDMIPIVMGGADYSILAPPNSYIDALSFESPRALGNFLISLAKDEERYNSYFEFKNNYVWSAPHYACQICKKLHDSVKATWYEDINEWWFATAHCKKWGRNFHY